MSTTVNALRGRRVALATTYDDQDARFIDAASCVVDAFEVTPETLAVESDGGPRLRADALARLGDLASRCEVVVHGVSLSIASASGWNDAYLPLLDDVFDAADARWHSEHLAFTSVDGESLGTMLEVATTVEAAALIAERAAALVARYDRPFLLENVVHLLPWFPSGNSDAAFLNAVCEWSGCGLLLDVYNLECDARNFGYNVEGFLRELDLSRVREVHVAGGPVHRGFAVDVHSRLLAESTVALLRDVLDAAPNVEVVTFEVIAEAMPILGTDRIVAELRRVREAIDR